MKHSFKKLAVLAAATTLGACGDAKVSMGHDGVLTAFAPGDVNACAKALNGAIAHSGDELGTIKAETPELYCDLTRNAAAGTLEMSMLKKNANDAQGLSVSLDGTFDQSTANGVVTVASHDTNPDWLSVSAEFRSYGGFELFGTPRALAGQDRDIGGVLATRTAGMQALQGMKQSFGW